MSGLSNSGPGVRALGRVKKGQVCLVAGCEEEAVRSLSLASIDVRELGLQLKTEVRGGKVYLCRKHYKEVKKYLRKVRRLEKWRRGGFP